jgi:hypothetical protein
VFHGGEQTGQEGRHKMVKNPEDANIENKMINILLPADLFKRVKACCDENVSSIQEFVTDAIIEKLELSHKERRRKHRL